MATSQKTTIEIPYNFDPWPHQEEWFLAFYDYGIRRFFEVVHRRGGKDKGFLNLIISEMIERVGNYVHVFPQRNRARLIVWEGIDSDGLRYIDHFPPELVYRKLEQDMMISMVHPSDRAKEGSIYRCLGSDKDVHLLVGTNPVGVVWSEFPEINPRMRTLVLPILRRNNGWEAIVCTPRGRNHAYRLFNQVRTNPQWHVGYLPISETTDNDGNPLVTEEDVDADIAAGMSREEANQEYLLAWDTPMPGSYYSEEFARIDKEGRIGHVPYDPSLPVYTAWDLGINDTNAIWYFQPTPDSVRFIDYDEDDSIGLPTWVGRVREKPYNYDHSRLPQPLTHESYEVHFAPHDMNNRDYGTGKYRWSIAREPVVLDDGREVSGLHFRIIPHGGPGAKADRIAASRKLLARAWFDADKCEQGIDALRSYRREKDEKLQVYRSQPLHDWASNGADAFGCGAIGIMAPPKPIKEPPQPGSFEWARKQAIAARKGKTSRSTFRVGG